MSKRKVETIDLTGDEEVAAAPRGKAVRLENQPVPSQTKFGQPSGYPVPYSRQPLHPSSGNNVYPTPPSSSQPSYSQQPPSQRSSQTLPSSASQRARDSWALPASTQEADEDIRREIDLTQDFDDADAYENFELYGIFNTKCVGIRYYNGRATTGEYVKVRREPGNPYDRNAIRIDNVMGDQIGHINRNAAAKLAPLMDSGDLLVEGALTGPKEAFDVPIGLKLFGTSDPVAAPALKQRLQDAHLPVNELMRAEKEREKRQKELQKMQKAREKAAASMRKGGQVVIDNEGPNKYSNLGGPTGASAERLDLDQMLSSTAVFNPREVQDVVNKFAAGEDVLAKMPMANQPEKLVTKLLPYQLQGLQWMLDHESPTLKVRGEVVQLWKKDGDLYTNIGTNFSTKKAPELASGGILADDMGLGKTIQVISLIMADPHRAQQPTLIVAPLSVMSNWSGQAKTHVKDKYSPRILTYHGPNKGVLTPDQFQEYDIVITTYQTMTYELFNYGENKQRSVPTSHGLFSVHWRRVVLDEGHQIRNSKAKMAQAACALMASSRWILTGTPIVNSLKDLHSHIRFLRLSGGLTEFEIFNGTLIRPLKQGDPNAKLLLQALMSTTCLRRLKSMKFVDLRLPEIEFHKMGVQFLPHEQERYDAFKAEAKGLVEAVKAKKGDGFQRMTHLLEVLLRLRQTCNHWKMCGEDRVKGLIGLIENTGIVNVQDMEKRKALQMLLQLNIDGQEECPICMDSMRSPVITVCKHAFCEECIQRVLDTQKKCPMCRNELQDSSCLVQPTAGFGEGEEELRDIDFEASSSKIETILKVLKATIDGKDNKVIVFSQWTTFLDILQKQLDKHELSYTRLDGRLNAARRDAAIEALNTDANCKIMLASLSVCSVGLNLVAANHVILSDSWWAPAIEDQAVDRVHRLGQTRDCKVIRMVVEGTIEDEVLEIQARKRKLAADAFGEKDGGKGRKERSAGTLRDIERMLGR